MNVEFLKRIILLFWAVYFSIVVASNLGDGLKGLGLLSEGWAFASGNYSMIEQVISIYALPASVAGIFFAFVIIWEALTAFYFFRAFRDPADLQTSNKQKITIAFTFAIVLWILFILSDELFLAYERFGGIEGGHLGLLSAQVLTFLTVWLLPNDVRKQ